MVALGLLVAVFGVGPALAKQVDTGNLGVQDASHAPQAAVVVAEDAVAWADTNGEDITYINTSAVGVFFITDANLETTATGTATWEDDNQAVTAGQVWTIPSGYLNATSSTGTYTLTAASYDTTTPANTPLTGSPTVTNAGTGQVVSSASVAAGTFAILGGVSQNSTTTATFSHHVRDSFSGGASTTRRAKVTSTSDPTGEYVDILEVAGVGNVASGNLREVSGEAGTTSTDGLTLTTTYAPIVDKDGDGDVDGADLTITIGTAATALATTSVSHINPSTGVITFTSAQTVSTTTAVTYNHSLPSPTSDFYRGDVVLTSDAAYQGAGDGRVWVQDGDTLTVTYLTSAGVTVSTDTVTVDGVVPTISAVTPVDGNSTNIVNPTIQFDVTDSGSGIPTTAPGTNIIIYVDGQAASNTSFQAITDGFRAINASGTSWITTYSLTDSTAFTWEIHATDTAGNTKSLRSQDLTIDTTAPTVTSAITGTSWDSDKAAESATKSNAAVKLTMSETIDSATVDAADFTVAGVAPTAAVVGSATGYKNVIYLTTAAQLSDAKPAVIVTGAVADLAGNAVSLLTTVTTHTATASDGLKAALTIGVDTALAIAKDVVKVTVDTDEKLATDGLIISIVGPSASSANGKATVSSSAPKNYSGSVTVATAEATGKYGVSIQGTDLGSNATNNLTAVASETVAATGITSTATVAVVTVANGPIADTDFDGDVDIADITSLAFSTNTATASSITAVDASARTITLTVSSAIGATETATVSYSYTTNTFEIDHAAPTVTYSPTDDTSIDNASPFVTLTFDEDEYPGDGYKTVELTKATVLNPDGTTTDLLTTFVTKDSIEFIWQASGLALGKYTLTVSATDSAGNKLTDSTSDFTVIARAKYSVSMRPGWNLISLPGAATDSAINSVITIAAVDSVLTYDPSLPGGWLTAVRDDAGQLAGTLTSVDAGKGYWVHSTTFEAITVDIPGLAAGSAVIPSDYSLSAGWNLLGVSTETGATTRDPDEYLQGLSWSRVYGYNNSGGAFTSQIPDAVKGTDSNGNLTVGQGYWVYLTEAGQFAP